MKTTLFKEIFEQYKEPSIFYKIMKKSNAKQKITEQPFYDARRKEQKTISINRSDS